MGLHGEIRCVHAFTRKLIMTCSDTYMKYINNCYSNTQQLYNIYFVLVSRCTSKLVESKWGMWCSSDFGESLRYVSCCTLEHYKSEQIIAEKIAQSQHQLPHLLPKQRVSTLDKLSCLLSHLIKGLLSC